MNLHGQMMNLPCALPPMVVDDQAYKLGHRDARHAAAALANDADAEISRLRDTQRVLVEALRKIVAIDDKMFGGDWDEIEEARAIAREAIASVEKPASVHLASAGGTEATARDAARFAWYFSNTPKGDWLMTYLDGINAGWTIDQWRASIDAAMSTEPKP